MFGPHMGHYMALGRLELVFVSDEVKQIVLIGPDRVRVVISMYQHGMRVGHWLLSGVSSSPSHASNQSTSMEI